MINLLQRRRRMNTNKQQLDYSDSSSPPTPPSPLPISVGPGHHKYCFSSSPSPTPPFSPPLSSHSLVDSLVLPDPSLQPVAAAAPSAFSLDYQEPTANDSTSSCLKDFPVVVGNSAFAFWASFEQKVRMVGAEMLQASFLVSLTFPLRLLTSQHRHWVHIHQVFLSRAYMLCSHMPWL